MSSNASAWAANQVAGGPLQKLVLLTLADSAAMDGWWRGDIADLARRCETGAAEVRAALMDLRGRGVVKLEGDAVYLSGGDLT